MEIEELVLPRDVIKNVNLKNWRKLWRKYMITDDQDGQMTYVWTVETTEKFIEKLVDSILE